MSNNIQCTVCGAMCSPSLTACDICGGKLATTPVAPAGGFGEPFKAEGGFGATDSDLSGGVKAQPTGFGQGALPSGFGTPPSGFGTPPSGFGTPPSGFGTPPSGFGTPPSGFGTPPSDFNAPASGFGSKDNNASGFMPGGFGDTPNVTPPPSYEAKPTPVLNSKPAEETRFAQDIASVTQTESVYWGFKECLFFLLKGLIPVYGMILFIMCLVGNPRKYPKVLTNYLRATVVVTVVVTIVIFILMFALGLSALNSINSSLNYYGGL